MDNARKFGGPEATIQVSVTAEDGRGVVRVRDEGPGVRPEDRERIFERYVQIGERLPNEPRGAGIGLYLVRWNAEAMGGRAQIVEAGPGTTAELSIPLPPGLDVGDR
jgi:signal transduction histidine kinase